ncbi:PqqD family protein [Deinococcus hopiensis]|uniref:Coenzyme PQQ synthesis protein D (PqqD) n=1 Tax=Deinococcus hopiensis KR-140 TaxID=695939 RepID=A0A1W1VEP1_9DEIO|nr:PqqD family protein [Deinococcus hopiensis]SMB91842.1 Coenzyme PQQ synthesis protein D (PqqD) [Deinococcus hopiensis KR-140]
MWETDPDVLVTDLGDELILMHAGQGLMFSLNATGRAAWLALPGTPEAVVAALCAAFEVDITQAEADARALLAELAARGVVRRT